MGLLLLAGLLELVMLKITPTAHDRPSIMWVSHYDMRKELRDVSARLIQLVSSYFMQRKLGVRTLTAGAMGCGVWSSARTQVPVGVILKFSLMAN